MSARPCEAPGRRLSSAALRRAAVVALALTLAVGDGGVPAAAERGQTDGGGGGGGAGRCVLVAAKVGGEAQGQRLRACWVLRVGDDASWRRLSAARALRAGGSKRRAWLSRVPTGWRGVGWFFADIEVPAALRGKALALALHHRMAFELYLDGVRVDHVGDVDGEKVGRSGVGYGDKLAVAAFDPRIIPLRLSRRHHTLAVRFATRRAERLALSAGGAGIFASVGEAARLRAFWRERVDFVAKLHFVFYGVTSGFGALHLLLFAFYRERSENLFFAISSLGLMALARGIELWAMAPTAAELARGQLIYATSGVVASLALQRFYYQLFGTGVPRYFYGFGVVGLAIVAGARWVPYYAMSLFSLATFAEQSMRIGIALVQRRRGAGTVAIGGLIAISATAYTIIVDLGVVDGEPLSYMYGFLGLYATISVHLAREFAHDKRELARQLGEIRRLSEQTLEREQEAADERLASERFAAETARREVELAEAKKREAAVEALAQANERLLRTRAQLAQAQTMASLGELVEGVVDEVSDPVAEIAAQGRALAATHGRLEAGVAVERREQRTVARSLTALSEAARVITDGATRLSSIAARLAAFARVEASEGERLSLAALVDEALAVVPPGMTVARAGFDEAPAVRGQHHQIVMLMRQLFENAQQAMAKREGAGTLSLAVEIGDDDRVEFTVQDDGPGIPEDRRRRVFEPGYTTRGVGVGSGLGLAIAYHIARAHGGELRLEPSAPPGARFVVVLPRADASAGGAPKPE